MSKACECVRGKFYFILLLLAYNNYGATIIILYRPHAWSVSGGGGNEEKTVAGASCAAVPHSADTAGNTDTAWFATDVFERPARGPPLHGAQTTDQSRRPFADA